MSANLQLVVDALKAHKTPKVILQESFDYDDSHLRALCSLSLNGAQPTGVHLCTYVEDITYNKVDIELFKYLLPICLLAWNRHLLAEDSNEYGRFAEVFFPALVRQSALAMLEIREREAVEAYVVASILDRMSKEVSLKQSGSSSSAYVWFGALNSFSVVFPGLRNLWQIWWNQDCEGHSIAVLQYISCLMYQDAENPIFEPWTKENGGGAPAFNETRCDFYEDGWRSENIEFLKSILSCAYIEEQLKKASARLNRSHSKVVGKMLDDWEANSYLVDCRIDQIPDLLSSGCRMWPVI